MIFCFPNFVFFRKQSVDAQLAGKNSHHIIEATFKAFARALRQATEYDPRRLGTVPRYDILLVNCLSLSFLYLENQLDKFWHAMTMFVLFGLQFKRCFITYLTIKINLCLNTVRCMQASTLPSVLFGDGCLSRKIWWQKDFRMVDDRTIIVYEK